MARAKGSGSVYQRADGKWVAQIDNGFTATGRRRYIRRVRDTEKAATRTLGELERIASRKLDPGRARQPLATYLAGWLEGLEGVRKPKTIAAYRVDVTHIVDVIGKVRLDRLDPDHVRQLMRALPKRGLSPRSALNIRATLHTAIKAAVTDRLLDWNPVSVVPRPLVDRDDIEPLTLEQARAVLIALSDHRLFALYAVGLGVGLRMSEALGLTWARVDLDRGVIQVRQQLTRGKVDGVDGTHYMLADLKTKKSRRDIPLPGPTLEALRRHRVAQQKERLEAGPRFVDGCCPACGNTKMGLVFTTFSPQSAGRPVHLTWALKQFQDVCDATIGRRPRYHDLRHTAATLLLSQGVPLAEIQDTLGHSSIQVTKDIYSHLSVEHLRGAASKMGEMLG